VEVVRRHEIAVHKFLARRAGRDAADDLLGEVWVRAFGTRHRFRREYDDALPWLYGIARNVLRGHWRSVANDGASHTAGQTEEMVDPWDEVIERLDSAAWARELTAAVRELPPACREVLLLVAWEELTPAEAADVLGIPQGTARSRLHRARSALRLALARGVRAADTDTRRAGTGGAGANGRGTRRGTRRDGKEDACPSSNQNRTKHAKTR
jgi:RNA polymerase sigma-70 factor (ECF subfamily)